MGKITETRLNDKVGDKITLKQNTLAQEYSRLIIPFQENIR